jgi:signal transduction histidine kinase
MARFRFTARTRLTVLYAVLFTACGAGLAALIIGLAFPPIVDARPPSTATITKSGAKNAGTFEEVIGPKEQARAELRARLFTSAGLSIGVMALASAGLGWLMAGRVLRPVHTVSDTARRLSEENLDERIPVSGPRDEMRELAETFNGMLGRLESAFAAQRRFTANASHELRGPMTTQRTLVEVAAASPDASVDVRQLARDLTTVLRRQERTIEGLLALASSEHGTTSIGPVRLDALVCASLTSHADEIAARAITFDVRHTPAVVTADAALLELLVDNLVRNAIRHNQPSGRVWIVTTNDTLVIQNTGQPLTSQRLRDLVEPFRRGRQDRVGGDTGAGLGLAIVAAVARAHGAWFDLAPRPGGGVRATVHFGSGPGRRS